MIITTVRSDLTITTSKKDKDGRKIVVRLRPGSRDYKDIDHDDPMVSEQLRIMRKHNAIGFDELLPADMEALAALPEDATADEKIAAIKVSAGKKNQQKPIKGSAAVKVEAPKPAPVKIKAAKAAKVEDGYIPGSTKPGDASA